MHYCKTFLSFVFLIVFLNVSLAQADETVVDKKLSLTLGAGGSVLSSEYKGTDAKVYPIPLIHYENEHLYVRGLTGGVKLYSDGIHELSATVGYLPQFFRAKDSDSRAMKRLDNRYSTMMVGGAYRLTTQDYGGAQVSVSADVLDKNDGFLVDMSYYYPITLKRLKLIPEIGGMWTSSDYTDYYYGVSSKESRKSGLKRYKANSAFSPYAAFKAQVELNDSWDAFIHTKAVFLDEEITDSPMVNKDVKYSVGAGLTYSF